MTSLELTGGIEDAITHFAAQGLCELLVDAGVDEVSWGWRDGLPARAVVESSLTESEIGDVVLAHVSRHAQPSSWLQTRLDGHRAVLSPRAAGPEPGGWRARERVREELLDRGDGMLDHRFVAALGRQAYWTLDTVRPNLDAGASRWEMKTRNRGETFIDERLAPLAVTLAGWDSAAVIEGLRGLRCRDEVSKQKPDSRTGTGLVSPRPVDNALAWCALWGLSATAVWWAPEGVAPTTAVLPTRATHPSTAVLPVFGGPVTPAGYRRLLRSAAWQQVAAAVHRWTTTAVPVPVAVSQDVCARGVTACVVFAIHKGGSSSAPERYLEGGRLLGLEVQPASGRR